MKLLFNLTVTAAAVAVLGLTAVALRPAGAADQENSVKPPPSAFEKLRIKDGTEYLECQVIRTEPDALIVRHKSGVARISFFDLSREIREAYRFDPFAAIDHYQNETERQREIRWHTFWDKQRHEAKLAGEAEEKKLIEKAHAEWIPVEAKVVQRFEGGFLARCKRVTFEKTKIRSKLGFLVDGPPKRKLVEFAGGEMIALRLAADPTAGTSKSSSTWKGYVNPVSEGDRNYSYRGILRSAPSYPAVRRD